MLLDHDFKADIDDGANVSEEIDDLAFWRGAYGAFPISLMLWLLIGALMWAILPGGDMQPMQQ